MGLAFWSRAQQDPGWTALIEPDGTQRTAGELVARVNQLTNALRGLGLRPGDGSRCCCPTAGPRWRSTWPRCRAAGTTADQLALHPAGDRLHRGHSEAKAFFVDERYAAAGSAAADLAGLPAGARFSLGTIPGFLPVTDLLAGEPATTPADRSRARPCTTPRAPPAAPRASAGACPGSTDDAAELTTALLQMFGVPPGQPNAHLVTSPNYHTAVTLFGGAAIHLGHTLVYMDSWDAETALACVERYQVTEHAHGAHPVQADAHAAGGHPAPLRRVLHALDDPRCGPLPGAAQAGHARVVGPEGV